MLLSNGRLVTTSLALCLALAASRTDLVGQDDPRGFEPYLKIVDSQYLPPSEAGGKQLLRIKLDVADFVPVGTKIQFMLMYAGRFLQDETETVFELKNARRKGVIFDWRPKKPLGPDNYTLYTAIWPAQQSDAVRKQIRADKKSFRPDLEPWAYSYLDGKDKIPVGSKKELAELEEKICETYDNFIAALAKNNEDFVEVYEDVKAGKKYVDGDKLEVEDFAKWLKKWRLQQAATQLQIKDMIRDEPTVHQKTLTAFATLENLGRMVSKRAWNLQGELEKQYGVSRTQVPVDPKNKEDRNLMYYDRNYLYKATPESMGTVVERIYSLVCPAEEEEPAPEAGAGGETGDEADRGDDGRSRR